MVSELILWGALAVLIALMALAVWAGRRGLHALGVVGPAQKDKAPSPDLAVLTTELRSLNGNLERLIALQEKSLQNNALADGHANDQTDGGKGEPHE